MRLRVTGLLAAPVRVAAGALLAAAACYRRPAPAAAPASYASVVSAPDRTAEDRALDAGRKPAELLAFAGIRPGMRVAELGAAGGYTTELLARAVGPKGQVYGQNSRLVLDRFAAKPWSERLTRPAMGNVVRVDRDFDDPLPPDARNLDAVVIVLFYHDTYWMGVDRGRMNRAVYEHLRPGGLYIVVDHSGRPGTGSSEGQRPPRIRGETARGEVQAARLRRL